MKAIFALLALVFAASAQAGRPLPPQITVRPQPAPDPALAGHYYLSGVREVGSELLLRADGRFEWSLAYGSEDRSASGTWLRDGDTIVLTAAPPGPHGPLYHLRTVSAWTAEIEDELLRRRRDAAENAVRERCPFFSDNLTSAAAMVAMPDAAPPSAAALRQAAGEKLAAAQAARARVEQLAARTMASGTFDSAQIESAERAVSEWFSARNAAADAASAANLPAPDLAEPKLPAACDLPPPVTAGDPQGWIGGIAVLVRLEDDRGKDQGGAHGIAATLHFSDGHETTLTTAEQGMALLSGPIVGAADRITLHTDHAPGSDQSLILPKTTRGVIEIGLDLAQLIVPAFTTMQLKLDDHDLVAATLHGGRYRREP